MHCKKVEIFKSGYESFHTETWFVYFLWAWCETSYPPNFLGILPQFLTTRLGRIFHDKVWNFVPWYELDLVAQGNKCSYLVKNFMRLLWSTLTRKKDLLMSEASSPEASSQVLSRTTARIKIEATNWPPKPVLVIFGWKKLWQSVSECFRCRDITINRTKNIPRKNFNFYRQKCWRNFLDWRKQTKIFFLGFLSRFTSAGTCSTHTALVFHAFENATKRFGGSALAEYSCSLTWSGVDWLQGDQTSLLKIAQNVAKTIFVKIIT
jgi:hypothetical protein